MPAKRPSPLGAAIADALDRHPRVRPYAYNHVKAYAVLYRTTGGSPFAVERTTLDQIRVWVGPDESTKRKVQAAGFPCGVNFHSGNDRAPGWNSNIRAIEEFANPPQMFWGLAKSVGDAIAIVEALD